LSIWFPTSAITEYINCGLTAIDGFFQFFCLTAIDGFFAVFTAIDGLFV